MYNSSQCTNDMTQYIVFGLLSNNAVMHAGIYLAMFSDAEI